MSQADNKRGAALAALAYIKDGIALGVGTGSTVDLLIDGLAPYAAKLTAVVSSSERSTRRLEAAGIKVSTLADVGELDLYIDGADEATKHLHLVKGGGGALTREKILAGASRRFVCIIDETKLVGTLGKFPLPIEVIPMARSFVARQMIEGWRQSRVARRLRHRQRQRHPRRARPADCEPGRDGEALQPDSGRRDGRHLRKPPRRRAPDRRSLRR